MKLLWVDDDGPDRFLFELLKLEQRGWSVRWARNIDAALRELASTSVDAVLLDQMMTADSSVGSRESVWSGALILAWLRGVNADQHNQGMQVFKERAALPQNQRVPVCIVSAFYDNEVEDLIRRCQFPGEAIPVFAKPIAIRDLMSFLADSVPGSGEIRER